MRLRVHFAYVFLLLACAAFPFYANAATKPFSDVPDTDPHAKAINSLKDAGIIKGYGDNTFKPDKSITRAEAVAVILKAAGINAEKTAVKIPFTDVTEGAWYFPMIQKGVELKKLKGFPDKTFHPNAETTLAESLVLSLSFFNIDTQTIKVDPIIYYGLDSKDWYAKPAQYAKNQNILETDSSGRVEPHEAITRGAFAEIVYRMKTVKDTGKTFDITSNWITEENPNNYWKFKRPADFEIFKGTANSVIWKRAPGQMFFTRMLPESVRLSITLKDSSENLLPSQYFEQIKKAYGANYPNLKPVFTELTLSGKTALQISIPEKRFLDLVISLPEKQFLVMYGDYGDSPLEEVLKKQLEAMELSYEFMDKPPVTVIPLDDRKATLYENILLKGKSTEALKLFPDKKLISTDAIGIGTGPVDYYYSAEANYTIKLERNSGTILNVKDGKTNAF